MSKLNLKAEAIEAYDTARNNPAEADWRAVAELLRAVIPTPKAKSADSAWGDYATPNWRKIVYPRHAIIVTWADGIETRMSFACLPGKPLNVQRGLRVSIEAYRSRKRSSVNVDDLLASIESHLDIRDAQDRFESLRAAWLDASRQAEEYSGDDIEEGWRLRAAEAAAYEAATRAGTHLEHLKASEKTRLIEAATYRVPAVTACRVECQGVTVATFDPVEVNERLADLTA